MADEDIIWLAQRCYLVRDGERVVAALSSPRKLEIHERTLKSDADAFGCLVQTGASFTRRFVYGRDALEALFHGLLSLERFLIEASRKHQLVDEDGRPFNPDDDGLLMGPIGKEYIREMQA